MAKPQVPLTPERHAAMESAFAKWSNDAGPSPTLRAAAFHFGAGYAAATEAHADLLAAAEAARERLAYAEDDPEGPTGRIVAQLEAAIASARGQEAP